MPDGLRQFRLATARHLRANSTHAEQRLWRALRRLPLYGTHFRRQVAIGRYVADFACQRARLIIEVDGSQHGEEDAGLRDGVRTRWLEKEGYRVLRFWNSDISGNLDGVLERIYDALNESAAGTSRDHPTPARSARRPSPSRGG